MPKKLTREEEERRGVFKKIVCCLLVFVFLFVEDSFAIEVMTIAGPPANVQAAVFGTESPASEPSGQTPTGQVSSITGISHPAFEKGPASQAAPGRMSNGRNPGSRQFLQLMRQYRRSQLQKAPPPDQRKTQTLSNPATLHGRYGAGQNAANPLVAAPPSPIEKFFSGRSTNLHQFGYDLFNQGVTTFAPGNEVPISPNYVIGPGDEIRIEIWGEVNGNWAVTVDRDGDISIPVIGIIGVTGLTFDELKGVLRKKFSEYYRGFEMSVSLGSLKSMCIYVVGNARRPGAYTVSSLSTMVSALFECGGPSKNGSMRAIELKRAGKTITTLDLYDFLLKGDNSNDMRLLPGDIIFIPPIGPVAAVEGNVERPAIFELKGPAKISDLLSMAGGVTPEGYLKDVQLERVQDHEIKTVIDTNFEDLTPKTDILVKDGDLLRVRAINNALSNAVTLEGNVIWPGHYQWFRGMRVSDLVKSVKNLKPDTYFKIATLERFVPPDYHNEFFSFNLGKALFGKDIGKDGSGDMLLEPNDAVYIYSKWDFMKRPMVRIAGAVHKPGSYEFAPNMKISDLVDMAGGTERFAFADRVELTRVNITNKGPQTVRIYLNLEKALAGDPKNDIPLKRDDYLFVRSVPDWHLYRTVAISGEVRFPGAYAIRKDERLSSLLKRAGGFTKDAYLPGTVFTRVSVQKMQQKSLSNMVQRLQAELVTRQSNKATSALSPDEAADQKNQIAEQKQFLRSLKGLKATGRMVIALTPDLKSFRGSMYDIELKDGDSLYIPSRNSVVNVVGAVMSGTTSLVYSRRLDAPDYIKMAGGYSEYADKGRAYVIGADGGARRLAGDSLRWDPSEHEWKAGSAVIIMPGDTIIVPERLQTVAWLQGVRDISTILMNIAVVAGVVIKLY